MSYSFNWDCTLPISNIQDIVSINIIPQTKAYDEGDYLSLRGQIAIDGEYVTDSGEQKVFNEYIPLDITLPNNGRGGDIKTDITNFDYDVKDDNNLFLTLNLSLDGYDLNSPVTLVEENEPEVEEKAQAPVLFTKEASVSNNPKEEKTSSSQSESTDVPDVIEYEVEEPQVSDDDLDYIDFDEVVLEKPQEAIDPALAEDRKETLTDKIKQIIKKEPVVIEEPVEKKTTVVETEEVKPQVTVSSPVVETVVEEAKPQVTAQSPVEEVVEQKPAVTSTKPVAPIPTVTKGTPVQTEKEEEILPFPLKPQTQVEEVTPTDSKKSDMFDMLYELEQQPVQESVKAPVVVEEQVSAPKQPTQPVQTAVVETVSEQATIQPTTTSANVSPIAQSTTEDSVANQFADGESILKIIFIQEEETTVTDICQKYNVPEQSICNLNDLSTPLCCGDRVMINYGKQR